MTKETIFQVTQALIAVIVVLGGGFALITGNAQASLITPIMALVIGWYFGQATTTTAVASTVRAMKAE